MTVRFGLDGGGAEMLRELESAQELLRRADEQIDGGALHPIDERLLTIVSGELAEVQAVATMKQSRSPTSSRTPARPATWATTPRLPNSSKRCIRSEALNPAEVY